MKHLKRENKPLTWPIPKKGTALIVKPNFGGKKGLPLLIILRDILGIVKNRKEAKKALFMKHILLNGKLAKDEKNSALLFDTLTIVPSKKNYRIIFNEKGKFALEEISEEDAEKKISKIINKKILNGKKIQINLSDGRNLLYDGKFNIGDSAILNLKNKKIEKIIPLKEGSQVIIYSGKHSGKKGIVEKIEKEKKMAILKYKQERINVLNKQLMAIE